MQFKKKLNQLKPATTREDLALPLDCAKLDEMCELLIEAGDAATSVQSTMLRSLKIKREWKKIQQAQKLEWEQRAQAKQAQRAKRDAQRKRKEKNSKQEIDVDNDSDEENADEDSNMNDNNNNSIEEHDEKKQQEQHEPMAPKVTAVTFLGKTITNQFLSTLVCLQQHIRQLQTSKKLLEQIQSWNKEHSVLGMQ